MSATRHDYEELVARAAAGEELDASERAFVEAHEAEHPERAAEAALWRASLELLGSEPPRAELGAAELKAWTERVLDGGETPSVAAPAASASSGRAGWLVAAGGLAAAAAFALWWALPGDPADADPGSVQARTDEGEDSAPADAAEAVGAVEATEARAQEPAARMALLAGAAAQGEGAEQPGDVLGASERLALAGGRACLVWTEPVAVVCAEGGELRIAEGGPASERRVIVEGSVAVAALDELGPGQRFVIETPVAEVRAIGTIFAVDARAEGTRVEVFEGVVELREGEAQVGRLALGEAARELGLGEDADPSWTAPERVAELHALARSWRERGEVGEAGFVLEGGDAAKAHRLDGLVLGAAPVAARWSPGAVTLQLGEAQRELVLEADAIARVDLAADPEGAEPTTKRGAKIPSAASLAAAAQRSRMARDYAETARLYRSMLEHHPDSPEAKNVPVRLGDVLMTLGDHRGALAAYERYSAGVLAPEAQLGRIKALRALKRDTEAEAAITAFRSNYPEDHRVDGL
ncbi:hypothetical protein PPSIR1_36267 [Plesiocystis pacifica SIR-1]|uniref:FecR protein domain-containing protein n=1 Tax=Plesiocystis pacifica SIR-1 TaxID=391625 RepID=A6G1F8_9BACT|nr:FecR domain-containing protein [Plesiocystis pacifica]EDM80222.1 hypothetical protein PPSIR1_36267 [Plesiocystis pacifica SIR-1]